MRKTAVIVFAMLFAATLVLSLAQFGVAQSNAPQSRELTAAELAKIEAGEILLESTKFKNEAGETRGRGMAIGYIKANKEKLIDTLGDFASYPQYMPRVKKTEYYLNTPTQKNVKFTISVLITVVYHIQHKIDRNAGTVVFALDKTKQNDIRDTSGSWVFKPYKDGCIAFYAVSLDTGRAVPATIEDYLAKKDLPNVVKALKERVGG